MSHYRKRPCMRCGRWVTTNALGRAAHERSDQCYSPQERTRWEREQQRAGWVRYPLPPKKNGNINENLDTIMRLVGSSLYEWQSAYGTIFIRRVQD